MAHLSSDQNLIPWGWSEENAAGGGRAAAGPGPTLGAAGAAGRHATGPGAADRWSGEFEEMWPSKMGQTWGFYHRNHEKMGILPGEMRDLEDLASTNWDWTIKQLGGKKPKSAIA